MERLFPPLPDLPTYKETLRTITQVSNDLLFRVVEDLCAAFADGATHEWSAGALKQQCAGFLEQLVEERNSFVGRKQAVLLEVLHQEVARYALYA